MDKPATRNGQSSAHQSLLQLDRLEELLESMDELGVTTRAEAETLLASLEAELDEDRDS